MFKPFTLIFFFVHLVVFCGAQTIDKNSKKSVANFIVNAEIIHDYCSQNKGIIRLQTDAVSPTFEWLNGEQSIDSIAYNLSSGTHSVRVTDIDSVQVTYIYTINDYQTCTPLTSPTFTFEVLPEGIFKVATNESAYLISSWNMGDGTVYNNKSSTFYHKYLIPGSYTICLNISKNGENANSCQTVNIPSWSTNSSGINLIPSSNNTSISNLLVKKACECGTKSYLFAATSTSSVVKIYNFDPITDNATLLPIDQLFGGVYTNLSSECFNNKLYFSGRVGTSGFELCQSDGTIAGTFITDNYVPYVDRGVNPNNFQVLNNSLYFDGFNQYTFAVVQESFMLNGNFVQKINNLNVSGFGNSKIFNNKILHETGGLLSFDGTSNTLLTPPNVFAQIYDDVNGVLIFNKFDNFSSSSDNEIWRSDGTTAGTYILKDIRPGSLKTTLNNLYIKHNNLIFFIANDGIVGHELWVTDGTEIGTRLIKDIHVGDEIFNIKQFIIFNNKVYFLANTNGSSSYKELWESDGTSTGTQKVTSTIGKLISESFSGGLSTDGAFLYFYLGNYFAAINNSNQLFQLTDCNEDNFSLYKLFKLSDSNYYFNGKKNNQVTFYKRCSYDVPTIEDRIVFFNDTLNISQPSGLNFKLQSNLNDCNSYTLLNQFSLITNQNKSFRIGIINNEGCEAKPKIFNVYKNSGNLSISSVARCNLSTIKININKNGFFKPTNIFKIILMSNGFYELPTIKIGDELIGEIPTELQNLNTSVFVKSISTDQFSEVKIVPSIINSTSAFLLGEKTILPGNSAVLSVLMKGNSPFYFSINGQNITTNANPYYLQVSPLVSTNYVLSNFQNSCNSGNTLVNLARITIDLCQSSIFQNGSLISGLYKSVNPIESTGILISPLNVIYESQKSISLKPGFMIEKGAIFKASIKNCQN